jgi:hypothetical protein
VLTHLADPLLLLGTDCTPFGDQLANVNASKFAFDVPLPPQPPGNTLPPRVRVKDRTPKGLPKASVTTTYVAGPTPVVHAVVDMTTPVKGVLPSQVGKIILARWRKDSTPVTRLQVHVNALEVVNPLKAVTPASPLKKRCSVTTSQDCSVTPCPGGEQCLTLGGPTPGWQIFLEANGEWRELPGLGAIDAPVTIPLGLTYDLAVPVAGGSVNLHASGKSFGCLEAQLYGTALPRALALYGLIDGAACLGDSSKDIGQFNLTFNGPDFGSGSGSQSYVTQSTGGDGGSCSVTTSQLCLTSADCPGGETCNVTGGAFKLHYTIRKVR